MRSRVSNLRIGFDIDGVLYPWQDIVYEDLKQRYNIKEDYDTFWKTLDTKYSQIFLDNLVHEPEYLIRRDIHPDIFNMLRMLSFDNELFYVTCRPLEYTTRCWFHRNNIPQKEHLYFVEKYKAPVVKDLKLDFYFEDRVHHVKELNNLTYVVVIKHPWNKELWTDDYTTLNNLTDAWLLLEEWCND